LVFSIIIIFGENIITFLNLPGNFPVKMLYLIPLGTFLFGSYQSLNSWLIRKKKFYSVSVNKLIRRSTEGTSQIGLALAGSSNGLIYSDVAGQCANLTTALFQASRSGFRFKLLSQNKIKYVIRKYSEFPRYNLIPALMSSCSYLLPPIFINKYFSTESAGFFDLAKLLLSIPMAFIASSISSVLLQKVSERYNRRESFLTELKPVIFIVGVISAVEIISILAFGEDIFRIVFGRQWIISGQISKIMVWSFAFNFAASSFTGIFFSMRKIKVYSIWQTVYFISIMSLLLFRDLPFNDFLKIYVLIEVACYISVAFVMFILVRRYESSLQVAD
jgi:O-antigen/teichoic acid export membrane protein